MDLSHWDKVTFFSRDEIASLLAGVDPLGDECPKQLVGKVSLYKREVSIAFDNAYKHAWSLLRGMTEAPDVIAPDIYEEGELPSFELRVNVAEVMEENAIIVIVP